VQNSGHIGGKDSVMNDFFANKWTKRVVSLLSPVYCALVFFLAYLSVFYDMTVRNPVIVCILVSAVSLIALVLMLYTRHQFLTKLVSLLLLPGMLLPLLLYFGQWEVLIPPLVAALVIFFFSGLGETTKTVFGTIALLLYLLGSLIYFLVTSLFAPSTVTTEIEAGTSPSGMYRYTVTNTVDSSNGCTKVTIESNLLDKDWDMVLFQINGLSRDVMVERPLRENVNIVWQTENRSDITAQIESISSDITVTLSDEQMELLGRDAYQVTYSNGQVITLSPEDYRNLKVTLGEAEQEALKTTKSVLSVDSLSSSELLKLGITVEDNKTVPLSSLTDADLETLGVPEQGDVMYYNGKVCFRYYIAILEDYFNLSNQEIGLA
jgi:hypothetical protein